MRKKTLTFDGASFVISPLNLEQVEEFIKEGEGAKATTVEQVICIALNNAAGSEMHTIETIRKELDLVLRNDLFDAILEYSGLRRGQTGAPQGEHAASAS